MLLFLLQVLFFFMLTEVAAYLLHRFLFHGPLWFIHRTHHEPGHGLFEWNDLFSLSFAAAAIAGIVAGRLDPMNSVAFQAGLGVTLYGAIYFIVHDVFTHGRFFSISIQSASIRKIKNAHRMHHTDVEKRGLEPYGLLLFAYKRYRSRKG